MRERIARTHDSSHIAIVDCDRFALRVDDDHCSGSS